MDFGDKKQQIKWNEVRLRDENERSAEIIGRINFISIVYTVFAVFSISLFKFLIEENQGFFSFYTFVFISFVVLFSISLVNTIRLLTPVYTAFIEEPKVFYTTLREEYLSQGIEEREVNMYLMESYLIQLQDCLSHNIQKNNRKAKFNLLAIQYALFALIPYSICAGIMLTNEKQQVQKIEIIKSNFMSNSNEKPKVDPAKVIARPPVMVKQNAELPKSNTVVKAEGGKKK